MGKGLPAVIFEAHTNALLTYLNFLTGSGISPDEKEKIRDFQDNDPAFKLMQNIDAAWRTLQAMKRGRGERITREEALKFNNDWVNAVLEIEKTIPENPEGEE